MPNPAEAFLIVVVVLLILSVHRLGRWGDALGNLLRRPFSSRSAKSPTESE